MADEENDPRLCDLTSHDASDLDSPIKMLEGTLPIEIKLPLLSVLPKYYWKPGADPYNFLNEFTRLCAIQKRPARVSEDTSRLTVFSFTLSGEANAWFRRLTPGSITTWTELKTAFLEYYFPSTKMTALKKEITSIQQEYDESLSEYWARFNRLIEDCPNHKISEGELLQTFYQGMTFENKHLMSSSSGEKFSRMRVSEARDLIQRLVEATREYDDPQWRRKGKPSKSSSSEGRLESRIGGIEKLLAKVAVRVERSWAAEAMCTSCGKDDHATIYCKAEKREEMAQANATGDWHQRGAKEGSILEHVQPRMEGPSKFPMDRP